VALSWAVGDLVPIAAQHEGSPFAGIVVLHNPQGRAIQLQLVDTLGGAGVLSTTTTSVPSLATVSRTDDTRRACGPSC
jgi:hypothetical protein